MSDTEKLEKFYDTVLDILAWAVDQGHINLSQEELLSENIARAKEEL